MKRRLTVFLIILTAMTLIPQTLVLYNVSDLMDSRQKRERIDEVARQGLKIASMANESLAYTWQYGDDPNSTNKALLDERLAILQQRMDTIFAQVKNNKDAIYTGGLAYLTKLSDDGNMDITELKAIESRAAAGQLSSKELGEQVLVLARSFDEYNFSERLEVFTAAQVTYAQDAGNETDRKATFIQWLTLSVAAMYVIVLVFIAIWLFYLTRTVLQSSKSRASTKRKAKTRI